MAERYATPEGRFISVSDGANYAYGLRPDSEATCWSLTSSGEQLRPGDAEPPTWAEPAEVPPGPFTALSAGSSHACGLRPSGDIKCWPTRPPVGPQTTLTADGPHTSTPRAEGTVA